MTETGCNCASGDRGRGLDGAHDESRTIIKWTSGARSISYPMDPDRALRRATKFNASPSDHDPRAHMQVQTRRVSGWEIVQTEASLERSTFLNDVGDQR